ncbi:MAG: hypothetical protein V3V11_07815, partial [Vicinamibacteria bacterium]
KANDDYHKRIDNTLGLDPSSTAFVFSTSRVFPKKEEWVAEKLAEGLWRDVRVVDADDLEAWLEMVPAVHLRISEDLGKKPPGVADLTTALIELASSTAPPLSHALIIAGRDKSVAQIHEALVGGQDVIPIAADSREEAFALFGASLEALDEPERSALIARSVVVWDSSHWGGLAAREESLLLIPMFENRSRTGAATRNGHRVVLPLGREEGRQSDVAIEVGRPRRDSLREELERLGVPRYRAAELAGIGRRSFLSLKRQIAKARDVEQPAWAQPDNAADVLPALFGGAWVDGNIKDREALENLSNRPYDELSRIMRRWANDSDPPLRQVGDVWLLASKEDAWPLLRAAIRREDLDALRDVCLRVFLSIDTRYDLPPDEQWSAGLFRTEPETSGTLRGGLADTLALLGSRSGDFQLPGGSGQDWASRIVREILEGADQDWRRWATLGHVLPLLAEAAPDEFLSAVERGTRGDDPILGKLFLDSGPSLWGHSPHTELLWALECLAWSPTHLPRAALALTRLARLDPGGNTTSRPSDSLRRIFLVHRPHTGADIQTRRLVLETIIEREPEVGWELLEELIPDHHSWWTSTNRPDHRDWAPDDDPPRTWQEIFAEVDNVIDLALANAGVDGARWAGLVGVLDRLKPETFDRVVRELEGLDPAILDAAGSGNLRDALRDLIARHQSFSDADWAMPRASVERLENIFDGLQPVDAVERYRWLFSERPALMDLQSRDWETKQDVLHEKRVAAAREIYAEMGLEGLYALASGADRAVDLGSTLGREDIISDDEAFELLHRGLAADGNLAGMASGFAWAASGRKGAGWLREVIESERERWTDQQLADFLLASSYPRETWVLVEEAGGDVPRLY